MIQESINRPPPTLAMENDITEPPNPSPPAENVAQLKAEMDALRSEVVQLRKELKNGEDNLKAQVFFPSDHF